MAEQEFKVLPGVRRCASTGQLINGKQVIRPLRFFVSDAAMKIVTALRSIVESRLQELRKDKETRLVDIFDTKISQDDVVLSKKNMEVMKSYAAKLFQGVEERKQLISAKEHRAAVLYLSCCYGLQKVEKGANDEMAVLKGIYIYLAVNGRSLPQKPLRKSSESSLSSHASSEVLA
ncbi:unnamed protein product [Symbiodinium necroappetens]|uniref:Uncharacterized protein n=1 Tax=Symbiodinium necroappetens TaxID=1628268 RepID=A0A812KD11_9DINO|nr:unnamed protein product [Symbiodinium necroappetens]